MTKGVYDHGLTPIRGFCPRATFWYKNILTILKFNFFVFHDDYILYRGMTKRQKSSLKFFTETETNKTLKLKIFFSVFRKTEKYRKYWKKTEKCQQNTENWKLLLKALFNWKSFPDRCLKYWKIRKTENRKTLKSYIM